MKYRTIGTNPKTRREVSVLSLGTHHFGTATDEATSFAILDRHVEAGGTFIDTSNNYAFWTGTQGGESEALLGRWRRSRGVGDEIVIATKVGARPLAPGTNFTDNAEGLSARVIRESSERSRDRLGIARLDLLYAHIEDATVPLAETVEAFAALVADGSVGLLGVSNHWAWRVERARSLAAAAGLPGYEVLQYQYSYLRPRADLPGMRSPDGMPGMLGGDLLSYLRAEQQLTMVAYSPLLRGGYVSQSKLNGADFAEFDHPGTPVRLAALREVAQDAGATVNQVVLAWLIGAEVPIVPLVGASSVAQLDESLAAVELVLTAEQRTRTGRGPVTKKPRARTSRAPQSGDVENATQLLHRLTSYEPGRAWDAPVDDPRVVQNLRANDPARRPWFFKRYAQQLPRLSLPRELPATTAPAMAVLAGGAEPPRTELDLAQLSRLLHLSAGVVRTIERPYGTQPFRAAGSAGARFPLELYVAVPEGVTLPAGVYWYSPLEHALAQVGPPPRASAPVLIVTGVPWRTGWRYRERGYRHMYWDAGTMLAQLLALADSAGLTAALYTRFPDAAVAALVGADQVHEMPVAVVGFGDAAPVEFPLVTSAQRAGECDRLGTPWARGAPVDVPVLTSAPLESVVLARGSQRRMNSKRGLPENLLRTSMGVALRGISLPHRVAVHDVDGLEPGVYRWPDLSAPARAGALRDELHRVCLGQALARDAAFVVIAAADIDGFDDRDYREAQLAAGLAEGRLHLAAYALGASASGMTFIDSEVPSLLGEPLRALLFTCVGVPQYASAAGGPPGAPTPVRMMTSR